MSNLSTCHPGDGIEALNRLPGLAEPLLQIDLERELELLQLEDSWQPETGRSAKTLAKYPDSPNRSNSGMRRYPNAAAQSRAKDLHSAVEGAGLYIWPIGSAQLYLCDSSSSLTLCRVARTSTTGYATLVMLGAASRQECAQRGNGRRPAVRVP